MNLYLVDAGTQAFRTMDFGVIYERTFDLIAAPTRGAAKKLFIDRWSGHEGVWFEWTDPISIRLLQKGFSSRDPGHVPWNTIFVAANVLDKADKILRTD